MPDSRQADVEAALADVFHNSGDMVTRWVLAAEVIEDNGARALWVIHPDDMETWDTLGLIRFADEVARRSVYTEDESDDD